jgi:hypothetical protein
MSLENDDVEQRLSSVEAAVTQIQEKLGLAPNPAEWVEKVSGSLADIPEEDYQEFLKCCRVVRNGTPIPESTEPRP